MSASENSAPASQGPSARLCSMSAVSLRKRCTAGAKKDESMPRSTVSLVRTRRAASDILAR